MRRVSLTFLSLLVTVGVFAQRGTCGNGISWKLTDETLTISGSGEMNDFNSSDHPSWDVYKDNITKVVVATGVTKIGTHAFEDYRNLRQITLNEGVETISECAFSGCTGIKELTLPQSIRVIKGTAFWGLGISTLTIPEGLETIEEGAFAACEKLTMVKWNAANCSLSSKRDSGPFSSGWNDNFSPVGEVVFGKNVTEIPNNLFYKCSSLKTVRTSGSISKVGRDAFTDTQWIDDQPEGIVNIDKALYEYKGVMTKVASIAIPEGMESITARVFENCKYLVGITLPTTLKSIGEDSFYGCIYNHRTTKTNQKYPSVNL